MRLSKAMEMPEGLIADVGRQVYVDGKESEEVDYGQALKTATVAGIVTIRFATLRRGSKFADT